VAYILAPSCIYTVLWSRKDDGGVILVWFLVELQYKQTILNKVLPRVFYRLMSFLYQSFFPAKIVKASNPLPVDKVRFASMDKFRGSLKSIDLSAILN